jgi:4,5-dihydroxyphthalate decarboxylase
MAKLPITLTCSDYARVMLLASGEIKADGIDLSLVTSKPASWTDRQEMMRRAMHDPAVHGGEASMAGQLRRIEQGDRSYIALPIFVLRNFVARDLYVRNDGAIKGPDDLAGRRIGMFNWVASGSIWYRHFLRSVGVDLETIEWWIGDVDTPSVSEHVVTLPTGVHAPASGRVLSDMLLAGEIDAIMNPQKPRLYHPVNGPIVRLFRDIRSVDRSYFAATGVYPPQHLVIMRRDIWDQNKWIARSITDAFARCGELFALATRQFPYVSPWLDIDLEETASLMGEDFHPVGLDRNRPAMEIFFEQAFQAGIVTRRITVDDYFAEFLNS